MDYAFEDETDSWFFASGSPDSVVSARFFDYDNDGDQDLVVARRGMPDNVLMFENAGTGFELADKSSWGTGDFSVDQSDIIVADYDLNCAEDIMVVPEVGSGRPRLLLNGLAEPGRFDEFGKSGLTLDGYRGGFANTWGSGVPAVYLGNADGVAQYTSSVFGFTRTTSAAGNNFTRLMNVNG